VNWHCGVDFRKQRKEHVKRAPQRLYHLRRLKKFSMLPRVLSKYYRCTIGSVPSDCIMAWYGNCSVQDGKVLQRVVKMA
jgi:hypothetical protein